MGNKSLLERIDESASAGEFREKIDSADVSESVIRNLRNLFNVRQGSVMTCADYGMPDFNDLVSEFPNAIRVIRGVIREQIRKYEPRLQQVSVVHIADENKPLELFFRVKAELMMDGENLPVMFETVVGDGGTVKVNR